MGSLVLFYFFASFKISFQFYIKCIFNVVK